MPFKEGSNGASGQQGVVLCRGAAVKGTRPGDKTCINPALRAPTSGTVLGGNWGLLLGGGQESQKRGCPGGVLKDGWKPAIVCFFICERTCDMFICAHVCELECHSEAHGSRFSPSTHVGPRDPTQLTGLAACASPHRTVSLGKAGVQGQPSELQ